MSEPVLKSQSPITVSFGTTLTLQTPSASPGDLVLVAVQGVSWFSVNSGAPDVPNHFRLLHQASAATGFQQLMWAKVPAGGWSSVVLTAGPDMDTTGGWWGEASVFGNVGYKQGGWLDIPGTAGDYGQTVRADIAAFTVIQVFVRVEFDELGVAQWVYGWSNGDLGFGLNSANRPIFFVNNTLGNPIGNVAANADIPGLTTNRKVWLWAYLDTATGNISYFYSLDEGDDLFGVLSRFTALGTTVAGTNGGTTPRVTNSDTVFYGTRDAATTPFDGQFFYAFESTNVATTLGINFTNDLPGGTTLVGGDVFHYQPTGEDFPSYPFDNWDVCDGICYLDVENIFIPARYVAGPDRLVYHVFRADKFGAPHVNDPVSGPGDWGSTPDRATNALGLYMKHITRTRVADTTTADAPVATNSSYHYDYYAVVIRGRIDVPALMAAPTPPLLRLNCADSYTAFFTEGDYETIIDQARWKTLKWGRVLDDISVAGGTFPDEYGGVNCLASHGGLAAWKHGLLIERNDELVWRGPITNVRREGDSMVVAAADVLARYRKRLAVRDALVTYTQADAGIIFHDVLTTHAALAQDAWALPVPEINTNVPVDRVLKPRELKYAWDLVAELLATAVDAFVANGVLFVYEPGVGWVYQAVIKRTLPLIYNVNFDAVYGMFTEQSWKDRPNWSLDGEAQGNFVVAPTADSGEYGFRTYSVTEVPESQLEFGILDYVDVDPLEVPTDQPPTQIARALRARSDSLAALRGFAPIAIESGTLAEGAPVDINNLLPGSIWLMDVYDEGYGQLLTAARLRRVDVTVERASGGGVIETIKPVLEPPGWIGALDA